MEAHRTVIEYERAKGNRPLSGVINANGLESAVAQPYFGQHESIHEKGAVLVDSIVRNHPFVDGNKRASVIVLYLLLSESGFKFSEGSEEFQIELGQKVEAIAARTFTRDKFAEWLQQRIRHSLE